jgi:hypothetical protein
MKSKSTSQPTTTQSLGALLKSARDIMRKDKVLDALKRLQAETTANDTGQAAANWTPCSRPSSTAPSKENCDVRRNF